MTHSRQAPRPPKGLLQLSRTSFFAELDARPKSRFANACEDGRYPCLIVSVNSPRGFFEQGSESNQFVLKPSIINRLRTCPPFGCFGPQLLTFSHGKSPLRRII